MKEVLAACRRRGSVLLFSPPNADLRRHTGQVVAKLRAVEAQLHGDHPQHVFPQHVFVERGTRYVMLLHLPADHTAAGVRDALTEAARRLPPHLKRSLTWDQGSEIAAHHSFTVVTDVPVHFCDPASPWQRGSNENNQRPAAAVLPDLC